MYVRAERNAVWCRLLKLCSSVSAHFNDALFVTLYSCGSVIHVTDSEWLFSKLFESQIRCFLSQVLGKFHKPGPDFIKPVSA